MSKLRFIAIVLVIVMMMPVVQHVQAQGPGDDQVCTDFVETVLDDLSANCAGLTPNTACHAHSPVEVTVFESFVEDLPDDFFMVPGDWADLTQIESITTGPVDVANEEWGVVVMYTQGNIPLENEGDQATMILMGDAQIVNNVQPEDAVDVADEEGEYTPMQAYTLSLGEQNSQCGAALTGMLLQLPPGYEMTFTKNGVDMLITADICTNGVFLPNPPFENTLKLATVSGQITLFGDTEYPITVNTGYKVILPLDEDGMVILPENDDEYQALLDTIEVLTDAELEDLEPIESIPNNILSCECNLPEIIRPSGVGQVDTIIIPGVPTE